MLFPRLQLFEQALFAGQHVIKCSHIHFTASVCGTYQYRGSEKKGKENELQPEELKILNKSTTSGGESVRKVRRFKNPRPHLWAERRAAKNIAADPFVTTSVLYDPVVSKFVNIMMHGGRKVTSRRVLDDTFERMKKLQIAKKQKEKTKGIVIEIDPLKIFHQAIENAKPMLGMQQRKQGGKKIQIPMPLPASRRQWMAIRWFVDVARDMPGNDVPMSKKLSSCLLDAYTNQGVVVQKKMELHKRAEANRTFANYRWW